MTSPYRLGLGDTKVYSTRPVGLDTQLTVQGLSSDDKDAGYAKIKWHIVLCCKPDNEVDVSVEETKYIDVSGAAGALIEIRNIGAHPCNIWTDY